MHICTAYDDNDDDYEMSKTCLNWTCNINMSSHPLQNNLPRTVECKWKSKMQTKSWNYNFIKVTKLTGCTISKLICNAEGGEWWLNSD